MAVTTEAKNLEKRLEATLEAIASSIKAIDLMRDNDSRFIFDLDLAKHALIEAGYQDKTKAIAQNPSHQETSK